MPNQENYKQNIENASTGYNKYTISRVVDSLSDPLILQEFHSAVPYDLSQFNVEINLYSLADNSLVYSDYISNKISNVFNSVVLVYKEVEQRSLLFVDFSKLAELGIPPGQYSVTLNFFVDEVGSYEDRNLSISTISPSRLEVELEYGGDNIEEVINFTQPSVTTQNVLSVVRDILNQDRGITGPYTDTTNPIKLTSNVIQTALPQDVSSAIQEYQFDSGSFGVYPIAQQILEGAASSVISQVESMSLAYPYIRFTQEKLSTLFTSAISSSYVDYVTKNSSVVSALPYDLSVGE